MRLIDAHCHLLEWPTREARLNVIREAKEYGVETVLVPSHNCESIEKMTILAEEFPSFPLAAGIHPWYLREKNGYFQEERIVEILEKAMEKGIFKAIGEIGLDYLRAGETREIQIAALKPQLALARKYSLPVILHCVKAHEDLIKLLDEAGVRKGIVHSFAASREIAEEYMKRGFYLSFSGTVTRPDHKKAREAVSAVPLSHLLIETDSPFIGTFNRKKGETTPSDVVEVAESIAQLKSVSPRELWEAVSCNFSRLFE